jgi:hypothetical protein
LAPEVVGLAPEVVGLVPEVVGLVPEVVGFAPEVVGLVLEVVRLVPEIVGLAPGEFFYNFVFTQYESNQFQGFCRKGPSSTLRRQESERCNA